MWQLRRVRGRSPRLRLAVKSVEPSSQQLQLTYYLVIRDEILPVQTLRPLPSNVSGVESQKSWLTDARASQNLQDPDQTVSLQVRAWCSVTSAQYSSHLIATSCLLPQSLRTLFRYKWRIIIIDIS